MSKQFKDWVYLFMVERMLEDEQFVSRLNSALEIHKRHLEAQRESIRKDRIEAERWWKKQLKEICKKKKKRLTNNRRA